MLNLTDIANKAIADYGNRYSAYIESEPLGQGVDAVWDFVFAMTQSYDDKVLLRLHIPQTNEKFEGVRLIAPNQETFSLKRRGDDSFVIDMSGGWQDFSLLQTEQQQEAMIQRILVWAVENTPEVLYHALVKQVGEAQNHMLGRIDDEIVDHVAGQSPASSQAVGAGALTPERR